ncbi:MAG: protein-glutamate O-methyltransferase CheR [Nitrospirota bacterium]|nr:protein-glutamate O-methyltransferase CheR [Nitrospirota bacterium]
MPQGPVLSAEAFQALRDLIRNACGIVVPDNKETSLEGKLGEHVLRLGLPGFREYVDLLERESYAGEVWQELFHRVSTGETYFFRNEAQNRVFAEHLLPTVIRRQQGRMFKRIKVWSAACATGEEAYTLAIQLHQALGRQAGEWIPMVTGTDIDRTAIQVAERGEYGGRSLQQVPPRMLKKYFEPAGDRYLVTETLRRMVFFKPVNFADEEEMATQINMDVIFCRNVLIYFDGEFRKRVVDRLYNSLKPGGYLVIGHSESLRGVHDGFASIPFPGTHVYQRPEE